MSAYTEAMDEAIAALAGAADVPLELLQLPDRDPYAHPPWAPPMEDHR